MPKRKASRRSSSRTRTVVRTVRRTAARVRHHVSRKMPGGHWGSLALNFLAGYLLPSAVDDSGLGQLIYDITPGFAGDAVRKLTAYGGGQTGRSLGKAGGIILFLQQLHKHPNQPINNTSAFAIGLVADDPVGMTTQGSTGFWVS